MPADVLPTLLDYNPSPLSAFFQGGRGSVCLSANSANGQNPPSAWQWIRPIRYCGDISLYAVHFEWVNQKPPTTASFDTQAGSTYTYRKSWSLSWVSRISHRKADGCMGRVFDNPGTNAIRSFHIPHTLAGRANPTRSRSIDTGDTTRESCSQGKSKSVDQMAIYPIP